MYMIFNYLLPCIEILCLTFESRKIDLKYLKKSNFNFRNKSITFASTYDLEMPSIFLFKMIH